MNITSLNAINSTIKKNITVALLFLLALSLIILNIFFYNNLKIMARKNNEEIASNYALLKSHISEKISIIASSNVFVDFIRSGELTQQMLKSNFIFDIRSLNLKEITGMEIESENGEKIFSEGTVSPYYVNLPLCYFDRALDSTLGACTHNLTLYFNLNEIVKNLREINANLSLCKHCSPINFLSTNKFGSFNVKKASDMPLFLEIKNFQKFDIITVNLVVFFFMVALSAWTWRRTNFILGKYLGEPLTRITHKLKSGVDLSKNNEIDELVYLIDQIQERETKLKHAKDNEKLILIGRIASQVAHDIRSPLAVLNAIVDQINYLPPNERVVFSNALQLLNEIANNLLTQYSNKGRKNVVNKSEYAATHVIAQLLDSIILEKKIQYNHVPVTINYNVAANAERATTVIIAADFKRVFSNIINNAVESINGTGQVTVGLASSSKTATITVSDSGVGMSQVVIDKILNGEPVTCKKEGNGIGLSSAFKFIKLWNGQLEINSKLNAGTHISVVIPILSYELPSPAIQKNNRPDLILIDDNTILTDAWKLAALHKNKKIFVFHNLNEVSCNIENFDRETLIYIDSDLGESLRGEQYAKKLYELGFKNIFLTTGRNNSDFKPMYWIKEILGKNIVF